MVESQRYKNKHLDPAYRVKKMYTPGADYISNRGRQFDIVQDGSQHKIVCPFGGRMPNKLRGRFTGYHMAERTLISYLSETDRMDYARWPGKKSKHAPFNAE